MPGLGTRLGRGGATTFEQDIANSDCILIMGSNMAENHPVAFRFAIQARERGARLIHVDPRFSRTSALADTHVRIRPGTDIALAVDGVPIDVLADRLATTRGALYKALHDARRKLRAILSDQGLSPDGAWQEVPR